jgi:glycosyltransferase involved in cell wall biosynthesis
MKLLTALRRTDPRRVALIAALLVPLGLLHAFVLAEIGIAVTDLLFLAVMARERNFAWARQGWFVLALLWWGWLVLCSLPLPGIGLMTAGWTLGFLEAFVVIRLLVFAVALQSWVLTTAAARRALWLALALGCLWIGVESWQQYLTGHNLFGDPRWGDGALTGPFRKPRAGAVYGHLLFVALLPPVMWLYGRGASWLRLAGLGLAVLGVATSVLIGQRMPSADVVLGLVLVGLFVAQLRRAALLALVVGVIVLAATPVISPPTYGKLVGETYRNLSHFTLSPYGELYTRGITMGLASPWHGWGYNGFRAFCPQARFATGFPALGIVPTEIGRGACNLHPHNYYVQSFTDAGVPGLVLFVLLGLTWLRAAFPGVSRRPEATRVGVFIGIATFLWPFGSTDEFPALYMLGWFFLLLGLGLPAPALRREGGGTLVILPRRERFSPQGAGAVALIVRRFALALPGVVVLGRSCPGAFADVDFVPVRGGWGMLRAIWRLRPAAIEVHQSARLALFLALICRRARVLLVVHNEPASLRGLKSRFGRWVALHGVDRVVCVSAYVRGRFMDGLHGAGVVVLPNPLTLAALPPRAPVRDRVILFAGRVNAEKGADTFVAACALALGRMPGWSARMMGGHWYGPDSPETAFVTRMRAEAAAAGVVFEGARPHEEVLVAMARVAIVVVPSRWAEPFGLTALEAMASGAALITTGQGGLREVAGEAARYFPAGDAAALAQAMVALGLDAAARDALAAAGLVRAKQFDTPVLAARLRDLRTGREGLNPATNEANGIFEHG